MKNHNINNLFSVLTEAVAETNNEVACLVIAAQEKFQAQAFAKLPGLNAEEAGYASKEDVSSHILGIKAYRDRTGCDLYEAKGKVDEYRRNLETKKKTSLKETSPPDHP